MSKSSFTKIKAKEYIYNNVLKHIINRDNILYIKKYKKYVDPTINKSYKKRPELLTPIFDDWNREMYNNSYSIEYLNDNSFGVAQKQQRSSEDAYSILKIGPYKYYAIFDGHGGKNKLTSGVHVITYCLHRLPEILAYNLYHSNNTNIAEILKNSFLILDKELYDNSYQYGSTCTMILIDNSKVYQVNLGDSRSMIFSYNNDNLNILHETIDHTKNNDVDQYRIINSYGRIGQIRIESLYHDRSIMVARAFGDFDFKYFSKRYYDDIVVYENTYEPINSVLSAVPDVFIYDKNNLIDSYFIVSSDGPFENGATNAQIITTFLYYSQVNDDLTSIATYLVDDIIKFTKTTDDTTIIVGRIF